jgi:hypothetical protein
VLSFLLLFIHLSCTPWLLKHETPLGGTECVLRMMRGISCKTTILPVDKDTPWIVDSFKKLNKDFMHEVGKLKTITSKL